MICYGLDESTSFSEKPNLVLDDITRDFVDTHPNSGARLLTGFLRSMGY